jgi:hypothetical protein
MLGVFLTIWLLLQLPVGLALGRFITCSQKVKRTDARKPPTLARAA